MFHLKNSWIIFYFWIEIFSGKSTKNNEVFIKKRKSNFHPHCSKVWVMTLSSYTIKSIGKKTLRKVFGISARKPSKYSCAFWLDLAWVYRTPHIHSGCDSFNDHQCSWHPQSFNPSRSDFITQLAYHEQKLPVFFATGGHREKTQQFLPGVSISYDLLARNQEQPHTEFYKELFRSHLSYCDDHKKQRKYICAQSLQTHFASKGLTQSN